MYPLYIPFHGVEEKGFRVHHSLKDPMYIYLYICDIYIYVRMYALLRTSVPKSFIP